MKQFLYGKALGSIIVVLLGHLLAYRFYWYATIYGFDKVMHALGGLATAYIIAALSSTFVVDATPRAIWKRLLFWSLVIGVGWEVFEYAVQFFVGGNTIATPIDSLGDVIFDMIGATISIFFVVLGKKRYNTQ